MHSPARDVKLTRYQHSVAQSAVLLGSRATQIVNFTCCRANWADNNCQMQEIIAATLIQE